MPDWNILTREVQRAGQIAVGEDASYLAGPSHPNSGEARGVRIIFHEHGRRLILADEDGSTRAGVAIQSTGPMASVHLADYPSETVEPGDTIVVRGSSYLVREIDPDGEGDADLILESA